ncbi:MAG TPA: 4Fe-4S binding protein [Eubacteriales bacterium]|nr:4Fe-4S binding protein [Clostridia bacterium]HRV72608.1 4Fe-4S binding protein [Eubacteriales bacterium]
MKYKTKRRLVQGCAAIAQNSYIKGYVTGTIYQGKLKLLCVPGLNCYSCPGALGSCPMGSLQSAFTSSAVRFPFYVLGLLLLFAVSLGRFICGWLCPFGFVQELIDLIPLPKLRVPKLLDRALRYLKYVVLAVLVIALPLLLRDSFGLSAPYYCKWLCPAGTLGAGIPLILTNSSLASAAGGLFLHKLGILTVILIASAFIFRPFCKYLCPLGAFYGLFNGISLTRMTIDKSLCTNCGKCERVCRMNVEVRKNINSPECIRCSECLHACPEHAIRHSLKKR